MVAPGTLTEPEIDEDVSFAAKEKPIKKTDKEINIFFHNTPLIIRLGVIHILRLFQIASTIKFNNIVTISYLQLITSLFRYF